jgi:hypothetical protein
MAMTDFIHKTGKVELNEISDEFLSLFNKLKFINKSQKKLSEIDAFIRSFRGEWRILRDPKITRYISCLIEAKTCAGRAGDIGRDGGQYARRNLEGN